MSFVSVSCRIFFPSNGTERFPETPRTGRLSCVCLLYPWWAVALYHLGMKPRHIIVRECVYTYICVCACICVCVQAPVCVYKHLCEVEVGSCLQYLRQNLDRSASPTRTLRARLHLCIFPEGRIYIVMKSGSFLRSLSRSVQ